MAAYRGDHSPTPPRLTAANVLGLLLFAAIVAVCATGWHV